MYLYLVKFSQSPSVMGKCIFIFCILSIAVLIPEMTSELCSVFLDVLLVT